MEIIHQGVAPKELEPLLFHCKCGTQVKCNRNEVVTFKVDAYYKGPDSYKHVLRCPTCHRYMYVTEPINEQTSSEVTLV